MAENSKSGKRTRDARDARSAGAVRDVLPEDLNAAGYVGAYRFPDNSRRRIPGVIYLIVATGCAVGASAADENAVLVNDGVLLAAGILAATGLFSLAAGWKMTVDEKKALLLATKAVGFPVGHSSAQQVWRGWRSRPTWRLFCYSSDEPPTKRGLVMIDAVDGSVVEKLVEDNPEADGRGE